ncbi:MAG: hypothetical protein NTY19_12535 [Planctomycetota bacterium]|nr:hypothetical protein [Planctomycetota bacterium]
MKAGTDVHIVLAVDQALILGILFGEELGDPPDRLRDRHRDMHVIGAIEIALGVELEPDVRGDGPRLGRDLEFPQRLAGIGVAAGEPLHVPSAKVIGHGAGRVGHEARLARRQDRGERKQENHARQTELHDHGPFYSASMIIK